MPRAIVPGQAKLQIYKPDNEPADPANPEADREPDIYIGPANGTAEHLESAKTPRLLGKRAEQASFAVDNRGGRYRRGDRKITSGDEVVFSVKFADDPGVWHERFRGLVRDPKVSGDGAGRSKLSWKCEDFVGGVLGWRYLEAGYQNRRVAGTSSAMVEQALTEKCPEIARDRIDADATESTQTFNAVKMLKVIRQLAYLVDARVSSEARSLVMRPLDDVAVSWTLGGADFGTFGYESDDGELANALRIDGGSSQAVQDEQPEQTAWTTVTNTSRLIHQIAIPKSEVSSIDVWTDPRRTDSGDNLRVRLQKDDGGEPVDPNDKTLDHAARTNNGILEHDGFTTFLMPDNDILDANPWLIIEATEGDGDGSGQDIGVNNAGTPAFRARYPFPISDRKEDPDSIDEYRRRELQQSQTSIRSLRALGQELNSQLDRQNTLKRTFDFDARSLRAHGLAPGDGIRIAEPTAGVAGTFVVTRAVDTHDGADMTTDIETVALEDL